MLFCLSQTPLKTDTDKNDCPQIQNSMNAFRSHDLYD